MTLMELSAQYRSQAELLRGRIEQLQRRYARSRSKKERLELEGRIRLLTSMHRDTVDVAALTEHYYDRGYHSNERYKI
jgi:hypothetical protein